MIDITVYSIFFTFIAIIAILIVYLRFRDNRLSLTSFILWILLCVFLVIFAFIPDSSGILAHLFGITRGLDFLIIIAIMGLLYLCFKLYSKIEKQEQDINRIVRELAIKNEIDLEDDKDN